MENEFHIPYHPNERKRIQLFAAGTVAIATMTLVAYLLRGIGIAAPDFAAQYGAIFDRGEQPLSFTSLWWTGLILHLALGASLFSFLSDYLASRTILSNKRGRKGVVYGIGLWFLTSIVVAPLAGQGFFYRLEADPPGMLILTLACWVIYGVVLEAMTRVKLTQGIRVYENQAA